MPYAIWDISPTEIPRVLVQSTEYDATYIGTRIHSILYSSTYICTARSACCLLMHLVLNDDTEAALQVPGTSTRFDCLLVSRTGITYPRYLVHVKACLDG